MGVALVDRAKVNVEYSPTSGETTMIPQDPPAPGAARCSGANGWQYTEEGSHILLCGKPCDDYLADPGADVRVVFGCRDTVVR